MLTTVAARLTGELPVDLYQESDVVATDEYGPFTKKLSFYGITLIARDDASDALMKRVAKTIKEIFPQDERMDLALIDLTNGSEKRVQTGSSKDAYVRWSESGGKCCAWGSLKSSAHLSGGA